jgi:hypothetical protein
MHTNTLKTQHADRVTKVTDVELLIRTVGTGKVAEVSGKGRGLGSMLAEKRLEDRDEEYKKPTHTSTPPFSNTLFHLMWMKC